MRQRMRDASRWRCQRSWARANLTPESISTIVTLSLDKLDTGWTITSSHIDVVGKVPGADAATFQKYAEAAEKGCPVSKVLNAKITMNAKLE